MSPPMHPEPLMRPLSALPADVIGLIVDEADFGDLKALILVSRLFYSQASRRLFETLDFYPDEKKFSIALPGGTRMRKDLCASRPLALLSFLRNMHFRAPAHRDTEWGCRCANVRACLKKAPNSTLQINRLFQQLQQDSLRTFGWHLATCIPDGAMGPGSHLVERQSAIETLSLTTFPCYPEHKREPYVLNKFKRVSNFSWIGPVSVSDLKSVRDFLQTNKGILKSLELDFLAWTLVESDWKNSHESEQLPDKMFAEQVLPIGPNHTNYTFPFLRDLSLSEASFSNAMSNIAWGFNVSELRSLKMRNCAGTSRFLHAIVRAETPIVLSRLEVTMKDHIEADGSDSALVLFLRSFQGLEDVMINPACPATTYWQSAANHISTLRSFAYHERVHVDMHAGLPRPQDLYLAKSYHQHGTLRDDHQLHMLLDFNLDCLGYCDTSYATRFCFADYYDQPSPFSCKLLHIRRSASELDHGYPSFFTKVMAKGETPTDVSSRPREHLDLLDCVNWAFAWAHFPYLQVLAFGDFAHGGRFADQSLLFCRNSQPHSNFAFRMMEKGEGTGSHHPFQLAEHEMVHFGGIHRPFEFLGACPASSVCANRLGHTNCLHPAD